MGYTHRPFNCENFSSNKGESVNSQGRLIFEYLERDPPYSHEPLADKVRISRHLAIPLSLASRKKYRIYSSFLMLSLLEAL